jgi:hypothetical protein
MDELEDPLFPWDYWLLFEEPEFPVGMRLIVRFVSAAICY